MTQNYLKSSSDILKMLQHRGIDKEKKLHLEEEKTSLEAHQPLEL